MTNLLYHYTSSEGLIGILTTRRIWATDIKYLNDSAEHDYALELVKSWINQKYMTDDYDSPISWLLGRELYGLSTPLVYVTSFSEIGDLLSQWRDYCPPTGGFALGFDEQQLKEYCKSHDLDLGECIYDLADHEELLQKVVDKSYSAFREHKIDREAYKKLSSKKQVDVELERLITLFDKKGTLNEETMKIVSGFLNELLEIAPRIKHPSFSEECEWRLIAKDHLSYGRNTAYRSSQSLVIPYVEIGPLEPVTFSQIVVGPCPQMELSVRSVERFAQHVLGRKIEVVRSNTPYRSL